MTMAGPLFLLATVLPFYIASGSQVHVRFNLRVPDATASYFAGGGVLGHARSVSLVQDSTDPTLFTGGVYLQTDNIVGQGCGGSVHCDNYIFLKNPADDGDWGAKENLENKICGDEMHYWDRIIPNTESMVAGQPFNEIVINVCWESCCAPASDSCDDVCPQDSDLEVCETGFTDEGECQQYNVCYDDNGNHLPHTNAACRKVDFAVTCPSSTCVSGSGTGMYLGGGQVGDAMAYKMIYDEDQTWTTSIVYPAAFESYYIHIWNPADASDWNAKEMLDGLNCADPGHWNDRSLSSSDTSMRSVFGTCCSTLAETNDVTNCDCSGGEYDEALEECGGSFCGTDGTLTDDGICYYDECTGVTCYDVTFVLYPSEPEHLTYSKFFVGAGSLGSTAANHYRLKREGNTNKWQVVLRLDTAKSGDPYIFVKDPASGADWNAKEHLNDANDPDPTSSSYCCADSTHWNDRTLPTIDGDMVLEHCFETCDGQGCGSWPSIELDSCQVCGGTLDAYTALEPITFECLTSTSANSAASSDGSSGTTVALSVVVALAVVALLAAIALIFYMRQKRGVVVVGMSKSGGNQSDGAELTEQNKYGEVVM